MFALLNIRMLGYVWLWMIESTFSFPEFVPECKESVYSICSFLRYSHIWVPWPDWPHPFLTMLTQNFRTAFNFCEFVSTCENWGSFIDLFLRNKWFKNSAIWLAESILIYISGTRFFPNIRLVEDNIKFFFKFKKTHFWHISGPFPRFLEQKRFLKKIRLCHTQFHKGF